MGLSLVSLGVLALFVLIELFKLMLTPEKFDGDLGYFAKKYQLPFENTDGQCDHWFLELDNQSF